MNAVVTCKQCNTVYRSPVNFCGMCGAQLKGSPKGKRNKSLNLVIIFYAAMLLFALAVYLIDSETDDSLFKELLIEFSFAALIVGFSAFDWKTILKSYRIPKLSWQVWAFAFLVPIASSILVDYFVAIINTFFFEGENSSYYADYLYLENPLPWAVFFVAVLPPIFEELAFRGFLFNQLKTIVSSNMTIVGTAFLFALIHFSLLSFLWIFPFGLLLGYLRHKYKTIWLGVVIHFIHNLIIVLWDYYDYQQLLLLD